MEFQHVNAKVFVDGPLPFDPSRFINVFHRWIQEQTLPELLIDVADYCHVPEGPGVLLIAHEADYSMDNTDGRWGLRYNRKAPLAGTNDDRLRQALSAAAKAACLLEKECAPDTPLRFSRTEFELFVNDRALAPNTPEASMAFQSELKPCLVRLLEHNDFKMHGPKDTRRRLGVLVTAARPFNLEAIQIIVKPKG